MANVPVASQSQQSSRPRVGRIEPRPNPRPTVAFGFVLDDECRLRWAKTFIEEYLQGGDDEFSREECEDLLDTMVVTVMRHIPDSIYDALPDIPRIRHDLLPIADGDNSFEDFVFALSTSWRLHVPLTQEIIESVRKALGLPDDEQPKWVCMPFV